jgi:Holliday junction resolvase RusA-like endonuclease
MRRDSSNFWKALLDALKGIVITDDCWQVIPNQRCVVAGIDVDRPRCEILIERN